MALKRLVPLLVLIPVGILILGYLFRPPPEVREERTAVQESILMYTDLTQPLSDTMRDFEQAWEKAHQMKEGTELREALKTNALPVLTVLTDSLRAATPQNSELNQIHQPLLEGYEQVLTSLQKACGEMEPTDFEAAHKALIQDIEALLQKHGTYEKKISGFYQLHNVFPPVPPSSENAKRKSSEEPSSTGTDDIPVKEETR